MNHTNPYLKKLISEIANKANEGRVDSNFGWGALNEAKKRKNKVVEAKDEEKDTQEEAPALPDLGDEEKGGDEASGLPDLGGADAGSEEAPQDGGEEAPSDQDGGEQEAPATEEPSEEDVADAQADANEKKAELEKAKAEKDKAEQELEKNSYVKLGSSGGVQYLLGKIIDHAFKTNSIDALASEMVQKLRIQTPEDFQAFSEDVAPYKVLPGIGELLGSMKSMATKQSNSDASADESEV